MSVRSYIIDDREKKTFLLDREVLVSEDILRQEMAQHLRPLLDLCRPCLRAEEAGRFPLAQGRRPPGDLLPRPGGRLPLPVQHLPPPRRHRLHRSARAMRRRFMCIYHGWTYGNDGPLAAGARRRRLCRELRQVVASGCGGRRASRTIAASGSCASTRTRRRCATIWPAPRTISISSSTSRRPGRWRSSPACRNTTSPPTGS